MRDTFDVIFIGGGIMGCSCALELAKRGLQVAVVEKGTLGDGPTGQSSGVLRTHYSNELTARMAHFGVEHYARFEEHVGQDCGFHRAGFLMLAGRSDHQGVRANVELQNELGIEAELLEPTAILELMPNLDLGDAGDEIVAAYEPRSGYADAYLAVTGMARVARELGVEIRQDTEVTGLRFAGGRVVGVDTTSGEIDAPVVVNTAGAWGARVAAMADVRVPIRSCRVQVVFFRRPDVQVESHPVVADFVNAAYFRPDTGGLLLAGLIDPAEADDEVDPDDFARKADLRFQAEAGVRLSRRYPAIADSECEGGMASLYAITPDWHPIVDELVPGSGFFICSGFSGHGFKLAPAIGVMVADLLTDASRPEFDPQAYALSRYEQDQHIGGKFRYGIVG